MTAFNLSLCCPQNCRRVFPQNFSTHLPCLVMSMTAWAMQLCAVGWAQTASILDSNDTEQECEIRGAAALCSRALLQVNVFAKHSNSQLACNNVLHDVNEGGAVLQGLLDLFLADELMVGMLRSLGHLYRTCECVGSWQRQEEHMARPLRICAVGPGGGELLK
eukprot:scaffold27186_cov22-Tisochrysis_lutea.AAC.4